MDFKADLCRVKNVLVRRDVYQNLVYAVMMIEADSREKLVLRENSGWRPLPQFARTGHGPSMHHVGLAFHLDGRSDVYHLSEEKGGKYRVYMAARLDSDISVIQFEEVYLQHRFKAPWPAKAYRTVKGKYIDVTGVLEKYGFVRVGLRQTDKRFPRGPWNRRWWHFQHEGPFEHGDEKIRTFGTELEKLGDLPNEFVVRNWWVNYRFENGEFRR